MDSRQFDQEEAHGESDAGTELLDTEFWSDIDDVNFSYYDDFAMGAGDAQALTIINEAWNDLNPMIKQNFKGLEILYELEYAGACTRGNIIKLSTANIASVENAKWVIGHEAGHALFNTLPHSIQVAWIALAIKAGGITRYQAGFLSTYKMGNDDSNKEVEELIKLQDQLNKTDHHDTEKYTQLTKEIEKQEKALAFMRSKTEGLDEDVGHEMMAAFYRHHNKISGPQISEKAYKLMLPFYNKHIKGKFVGAAGFDKNQVRDAKGKWSKQGGKSKESDPDDDADFERKGQIRDDIIKAFGEEEIDNYDAATSNDGTFRNRRWHVSCICASNNP